MIYTLSNSPSLDKSVISNIESSVTCLLDTILLHTMSQRVIQLTRMVVIFLVFDQLATLVPVKLKETSDVPFFFFWT